MCGAFRADIAVAQEPIVLSADGPANACSGGTFAITFSFKVDTARVDALGTFDIPQPKNATYVSLKPLQDTTGEIGHSNSDPTLADTHTFSSTTSAEGAVQFVLRTEADFVGPIEAVAYIRGTGTAASNRVSTMVAPCAGSLPGTGFAPRDGTPRTWPAVVVLLIALGAVCLAVSSRFHRPAEL